MPSIQAVGGSAAPGAAGAPGFGALPRYNPSMLRALLALVLVSASSAEAASVYQCKDEKGKVTLTDTPCPGETQKVTNIETPDDRGKKLERESGAGGSVVKAVRPPLCKSIRDSYNGLDARQLEAYRTGNQAETKRIIERRRTLGADMTKWGC